MPKFASQRFLSAILAAGLLFAAPSLEAQNKYDVLARVLQPYGALFYSKATTKAMQADVILREGPPTATEFSTSRFVSFCKCRTNSGSRLLTRNIELSSAATGKRCGFIRMNFGRHRCRPGNSPDRRSRIPDFHLPLKDQQIVWIPALFQILRFESDVRCRRRTNMGDGFSARSGICPGA